VSSPLVGSSVEQKSGLLERIDRRYAVSLEQTLTHYDGRSRLDQKLRIGSRNPNSDRCRLTRRADCADAVIADPLERNWPSMDRARRADSDASLSAGDVEGVLVRPPLRLARPGQPARAHRTRAVGRFCGNLRSSSQRPEQRPTISTLPIKLRHLALLFRVIALEVLPRYRSYRRSSQVRVLQYRE